MSSTQSVAKPKPAGIQTAHDLRVYIANCMLAVGQGEMSVPQGVVIKGMGDTINDSLYSEIKLATLQRAVGIEPPAIGDLKI